jgi:hypothetical protein
MNSTIGRECGEYLDNSAVQALDMCVLGQLIARQGVGKEIWSRKQCRGAEIISFGSDSGSVEPQIRIAAPALALALAPALAPAPAMAQDSFIRYLEKRFYWLDY